MKKNISSSLARVLRLENLESRQMLSVAPGELAVVTAADSALVAETDVTNDAVDLGDVVDPTGENNEGDDAEVEASTVVTVSQYDSEAHEATISWDADENAASYSVQVSRNGGASWVDYAQDLAAPSSLITNVQVGRTYAFRVFALDAEGEITTTYDELVFTPYDMHVSNSAFMFGETISVEIVGAEGGGADLSWFYVVDGENVEIEDAHGLAQYKPTQAYDVVIVSTGASASAGCDLEATVPYVKEHASTIVTTLDDVVALDGFVSLREAVTRYADDGDVVTFDEALANGVITLTGGQIDVKNSITIDASSVGAITIDAGGASRIFQTSADSVTLNSITMVNGYSQSVGGALFASAGAELAMFDVRMLNSKADYHGGAFYASEGLRVSMVNAEITNNEASIYGSAICAYGADLTLAAVTIAGNASADSQGAVFLNNNANASFYNSIVAANEGGDVVVGLASDTSVNGYYVLSSYADWSNEDAVVYEYNPEAGLFADAENGDYKLSPNSQAMDVGGNDLVTSDYDLAGSARIQSGVVDLGAYEFAGRQIGVNYDSTTRQATLTWIPLSGAVSYKLLLSRDGAEQVEYAKNITELTTTVNGLYVGSSYTFYVVGVAEDGTQLSVYRETTFAPISLAVENATFRLGDTITTTLKGASNAEAFVQWYYITDEGDVEIEGANTLEYTPTSNLFDLRVVATGVNDSLGSDSSLTIGCLDSRIDVVYDGATRVANIAWEAIDGISSYKVRISRDAGQTWIDYAKGVKELTATVNGLWAGREIGFRVYGETETGTTLAYRQASFTPINLVSATDVFAAGETISVELKGAASASAYINWYLVTEEGDVEIEDAAGLCEYAPTGDAYDVKVVATGTGESEGATAALLFSSSADAVAFKHDAQTRQATMTWRPIDGACGYRVRISRDGGATWNTYLRDVDGVSANVNGLYVGKSYDFRVYAVDENGVSTDQYREATFAPVGVASDDSFKVGDTASVALKGADNVSADLNWYYITAGGDVEIPDAQGLLEYSPVFDVFNLRVVATGTGVSAGSTGETIVYSAGDPTAFGYDSETHVGTLVWRPIDDAVKYKVQISRDGGENWYQYAKDVTGSTQQINGLYVAKSYEFRVIGFAEDGTKLETIYDVSYAPESTATEAPENVDSESLLDQAFADYFAEDF